MADTLTAEEAASVEDELAAIDRRLRRALDEAPGRASLVLAMRGLERRVRALRLVIAAQPGTDGTAYLDALFFVAGDLAEGVSAARARLDAAIAARTTILECEAEREAIEAASDTRLPEIAARLEPLPW